MAVQHYFEECWLSLKNNRTFWQTYCWLVFQGLSTTMTNNHVCLHLGKNNFKASQSQSHEEASSKPFFSTKWTFEKRMYFHPTRKDVSIFCDIVCYLVTFQTLPIYMLICFSSQVHSKIVRVGVAIKKYITNSLFSSIL